MASAIKRFVRIFLVTYGFLLLFKWSQGRTNPNARQQEAEQYLRQQAYYEHMTRANSQPEMYAPQAAYPG